jgi:hypothetical protein
MASNLWGKFQSGVRWIYATTLAAIAVIEMAPPLNVIKHLDAVPAVSSAPVDGDSGVSIEGIRWVDICYRHSDPAGTSGGTIWLYNDVIWAVWDSEVAFDKEAGALNAFDSGSYSRMAIQITTAPSAGTVDVYINNHNTES